MTVLHIHPDCRALLEANGLTTFDALFAAGEAGQVDGHWQRAVSRVELRGPDGRNVVVYLKRHWGTLACRAWRDLLHLARPLVPAQREWRNAMRLAEADIAVAVPVAWGRSDDGDRPRALIASRGVAGPSLAEWLYASRAAPPAPALRRAVAEAVGRAVRRLHDAGFSFPDLYGKHLFLDGLDGGRPRVVLIDPQRLGSYTIRRSQKNLAALWVSTEGLGVSRADRLRVFRAYLGYKTLDYAARQTARLVAYAAARMPGRGQNPNLLESRRTAPAGGVPAAAEPMIGVDGGRLRIERGFRPVLEAADLATLDQVMAMPGGRVYRKGFGRSTVRVELADPAGGQRAVYVKRYTRVPLRMKLRRTLGLNPPISFARNEERGLVRLVDAGIATMRCLAVGEEMTRRGRRERSCILTEEIPGATQADDYCQAAFAGPLGRDQVTAKRRLVRQMAGLARRMHAARLSHRDFYLCHLMVRPVAGAEPVLHLIDLQRLTHHRRGIGRRWVVKDLAALLFSSWPSAATGIRSPVFTNTDRMRFARAYFALPRLGQNQKRLLRQVVAKARGVASREARRARRGGGA